jgi:UDP-N-acetylglucosamine pyrophosphorylase
VPTPNDCQLVEAFEAAGQGHVFRFLDSLDARRRQALLDQARRVDLEEMARLIAATGKAAAPRPIGPPGNELIRHELSDDYRRLRRAARERGMAALEEGRVAVVVAAGGQGTRLGSAAPKGMWPCGPASGKPLLQWHAEKTLYWSRKLGRAIPLVLMVSEATEVATQRFLRWHDYFGLDPTWIKFACQASLPAVDAEGRFLLEDRDRIAVSPNGHGGVYRALRDAGLLDLLTDVGVQTLSYIQVDNPLIRPVDPVFVGFHLRRESLISSKAVRKTEPDERVGVFATVDGRSSVVEYSELTTAQAREADPDGELKYGHGSIAAHCIELEFAARMAADGLPFHRAHKKVSTIDADGNPVAPGQPNATKFESFLFDAIPLAERSLVVETLREHEFSPIKNATGNDSPATARRDLEAAFRSWMEGAGEPIPVGALEVPPLVAPDEFEYRIAHGRVGDR